MRLNLVSWFFGVLTLCLLSHASYAQLERLLMPGPLAEAHADLEKDCNVCHERSSDQPTEALCLACHEAVAEDLATNTGFHGKLAVANSASCIACHTDHEGRDADIVGMNSGAFSHDFTDFPLHGAHLGVSCDGCHATNGDFRDASESCHGCHKQDDTHQGNFGEACLTCHNDQTWMDIIFDHQATAYPLTGAHKDTACQDCHQNQNFEQTPQSCNTCHNVDDVHEGNNGTACQDCHSTASWKQNKFDHLAETGFPLSDGHSGLLCQDCHTRDDFKDNLVSDCYACHKTDDSHQERMGAKCGDCHSTQTWSEAMFDHSETGFELLGAHTDVQCVSCHKESTDVSLSTTCRDCHASDDVHAGQLNASCGDCHGNNDWISDVVFDHDLTDFPLTGLHAATQCQACHQSNRFKEAELECGSCHQDDDPHQETLGNQCSTCHNTNDWNSWSFDHNLQTTFPLIGSHEGLSCTSCHSPSTKLEDTPSTCASCHQADDVHDGEFGQSCGRCHNSHDFSEIDRL
ncbi:MAG: cytochrome c3 family protein [Pseudomonadota bacterium]